jgi:very-short-patch-repair endonuclease
VLPGPFTKGAVGLAGAVSTSQDEVRALVRREGVVSRRAEPRLRTTIDWLVRTGELAPVLPGVYTAAGLTADVRVRALALQRWDPDAVITGAGAARFTFWPLLRVDTLSAAVRRQAAHPGFRLVRRTIPDELLREHEGLRLTAPALTALDLCEEGTDGIDHVLRSRAATLAELWEAFELTRGRRGNRQRLRHLLDSRSEPWSAAERVCHRLLHDAGIVGWTANLPVRAGGRDYYLDVAFPDLGVVVEIDGRLHEDDPEIFENDRWRQNDLVLDGWVVVRFTWAMLDRHPDVVLRTVRSALEVARSGRPLTFLHSMR